MSLSKKLQDLYDTFTLTDKKLGGMTYEELQDYVMKRGQRMGMSDAEASQEFKALNKQRMEYQGRDKKEMAQGGKVCRGRKAARSAEKAR